MEENKKMKKINIIIIFGIVIFLLACSLFFIKFSNISNISNKPIEQEVNCNTCHLAIDRDTGEKKEVCTQKYCALVSVGHKVYP